MADSRGLYGRRVIYTDAEEITEENVADVLNDARADALMNELDIRYLYEYYKGKQPILSRTKEFNKTICNRIVENRAKEISDFKTGYLLSAPIQYIDTANNDNTETVENSDLRKLNLWMRSEDKEAADLEIAFWQSVCGTAFRMLSPKEGKREDKSESPFDICVLDPRYTFLVYSSRLSHEPMLGVTYVEDELGNKTYWCYTDKAVYTIDKDVQPHFVQSHALGMVPIIEYPSGPARMGDFEQVVPILDAINIVQSNRVDGIEQFVQAILVMQGANTSDTEAFMEMLRQLGGLNLPEGADAHYLTLDLDQTQTQTLVDGLYNDALKVCGMPNPKSGYSTSDTGAAVILRDGWSAAEAVACRTETWFKKSERKFLNMAIDFCNTTGGLDLEHSDVDIRFPRRNYTNDTSNVDNLIKLLSSDWVRPEFAYEHCNLTADPHTEYLLAKTYHDEQEEKQLDQLTQDNGDDEDDTTRQGNATDDEGNQQAAGADSQVSGKDSQDD